MRDFLIPTFAGSLCFCALFIPTHPVTAQALPDTIPGAAEPGRRHSPAPPLPAPKPAALELTIKVPAGARPPSELLNKTFRLRGIALDGVTAYRREELSDLFGDLIGKTITFGRFYAIAAAIQARYHADGYFLSFAFVPPQRARDGMFRIAVVEGYVETIRVIGVDGRLKQTIKGIVGPVAGVRPLRLADLERRLLIAGKLAGTRTTGVLQRSKSARGASELVVRARHKPLGASISLNNRGSEFTGPWRIAADATVNSLFGQGEAMTGIVSVARDTDELKSIGARYSQPIGTNGLSLGGSFRVTNSNPGFTLGQFGTRTKSRSGDLDLTYPLILRRGQALNVGLGLSYLDSEIELLGSTHSRDRIRTARASVGFSQSGFLGGRNGANFEFTQGLPILAATDPDRKDTSRADSEPNFNKVTLDLVHTRSFMRRFDLRARATGQYGFIPLPASHEFALGGERYGRAFNPGELTGESGFGVSFEAGYNFEPGLPAIRRARPYAFYDFGVAWNEQTSSSTPLRKSLGSTGLGVRANLLGWSDLRMEYAVPVGHTPGNEGDRSGRFFFFVSARF